ncbi:N-acetyltransferase [Providencia rettgeri]|uniref:N-acetyltransferase n=2 Tax=Providencia rettgeri TaxID=587 RepID=A0AAP2JWV1_PRORE|nr:N-acetyltransferase [Providencia rettgeri]MBX6953688.1 N-acetyltransferase [Providencia rettgeri]MBX6961662.1 N-acetyltransferase [Providencia rettgeri]MBX6972986.1 N-acetyltransferase [Providencia rettgeri]MBX6979555.1 N-acetyltransferase [Providencia rettgeri]
MMNIQSDHNSFFILSDDKQTRLAEITFVYTGDELAIIDHTLVDESLKGKGIAKLLVAKVVERMRKERRKVIPLCPFAKAIFDRTPEYNDIRQ